MEMEEGWLRKLSLGRSGLLLAIVNYPISLRKEEVVQDTEEIKTARSHRKRLMKY